MGGAINVDGNVSALNNSAPENNQGSVYGTNHYAEWNIFLDPLAAKKVFYTDIPITLVPLDACNDVILQPIYDTIITADDPAAKFTKQLFICKDRRTC